MKILSSELIPDTIVVLASAVRVETGAGYILHVQSCKKGVFQKVAYL